MSIFAPSALKPAGFRLTRGSRNRAPKHAKHIDTAWFPAFIRALARPNLMPAGTNLWEEPEGYSPKQMAEFEAGERDAPPSPPVVLIHGTWMNAYNTWSMLAPKLHEAGHRVFAMNYGRDTTPLAGRPKAVHASTSLREGQRGVARFIEGVLDHTGAPQVDLIGHSQGVAQARLYLHSSGGVNREDPSKNKVRQLIGFGGCNHGTTMSGLGTGLQKLLGAELMERWSYKLLGGAAVDQLMGSKFMDWLNKEGDTHPGVEYLMIMSRYDEIATPWRSQRLEAGEGHTVRNVLLQDEHKTDISDHLSILYSPAAIDLVHEALHPEGKDAYRRDNPRVRATVLPFLGELRWRRNRKRG